MTTINATQIVIETVVPTIKLGEIIISADRRSTETNKLTDAERIRRAVLPAGHWGEMAATLNGAPSQSLTDALREAMRKVANKRLADTLAETPEVRLVNLTDYSIPSLLAWEAETATGRGAITFTRDDVTAWFAMSATRTALAVKHATNTKLSAILAMVDNSYAKLAAKNHGLKDGDAARKLVALIDAKDLEGDKAALVTELIGRLEHIAKTLDAKANEDSISMDDL